MKRYRYWMTFVVVLAMVMSIPRIPSWIRSVQQLSAGRKEACVSHHVKTHLQTMEELAERTAASGEGAVYHGWEMTWEVQDQIVKFLVSYTGIVPASVEKGVFFSEEKPERLMGMEYEVTVHGLWYDRDCCSDGNNFLYVRQITDHWYWYELRW